MPWFWKLNAAELMLRCVIKIMTYIRFWCPVVHTGLCSEYNRRTLWKVRCVFVGI